MVEKAPAGCSGEPGLPVEYCFLVIKRENCLTVLSYLHLPEKPSVDQPVASEVFHDGQPIWLYDEIDLAGPSPFRHEILVSNGSVIRIMFRKFRLSGLALYPIVPTVMAAAG